MWCNMNGLIGIKNIDDFKKYPSGSVINVKFPEEDWMWIRVEKFQVFEDLNKAFLTYRALTVKEKIKLYFYKIFKPWKVEKV